VLEFFGDSVLSTAIVTVLMEQKTERYSLGIRTQLTEGDFSNIRSKLSDKKNLAKSTEALGLQKFLLLGEGDKKLGIDSEPSVMEDLFESIIGAVYIDCGMDIKTVISVVRKILDVSVYLTATSSLQSYKNALQEYCADKSRRLPAPVYKTVSEEGPDHRKVYERACYIGEKMFGVGKGKNTKLADSLAAEAALARLKSECNNDSKPRAIPTEATARLKEYAQKNKLPSPEFRDLGESESSTESEREYVIECRLSGVSAKGVGKSKQDARALACQAVLDALGAKEKEPKKKDSPEVNKKAPKEKKKSSAEKKKSSTEKKSSLPRGGERATPKKREASTKPKRAPHYHNKRS
jgi:ribonuclease-3